MVPCTFHANRQLALSQLSTFFADILAKCFLPKDKTLPYQSSSKVILKNNNINFNEQTLLRTSSWSFLTSEITKPTRRLMMVTVPKSMSPSMRTMVKDWLTQSFAKWSVISSKLNSPVKYLVISWYTHCIFVT